MTKPPDPLCCEYCVNGLCEKLQEMDGKLHPVAMSNVVRYECLPECPMLGAESEEQHG